MKTITIIAAAALTFGSVTAHAQESVVERAVGKFVEHAITMTKSELSIKLEQSISNAAYNFSLTDNEVNGKIEITELASVSLPEKSQLTKQNQ